SMKSSGSHLPSIFNRSMSSSLHRKYLHHLVAEVVYDFHSKATRVRARERARGIAVEGRPSVLVDLGLQGRFERFIRVVGAHEIGMPDEEAFLVVIRVDEPGGDV